MTIDELRLIESIISKDMKLSYSQYVERCDKARAIIAKEIKKLESK